MSLVAIDVQRNLHVLEVAASQTRPAAMAALQTQQAGGAKIESNPLFNLHIFLLDRQKFASDQLAMLEAVTHGSVDDLVHALESASPCFSVTQTETGKSAELIAWVAAANIELGLDRLTTDLLLFQIVARGGSVDAKLDGLSPLHRAARSGLFLSTLALGLKHADVNELDDEGHTPLHRACLLAGHDLDDEENAFYLKSIDCLLACGADPRQHPVGEKAPLQQLYEALPMVPPGLTARLNGVIEKFVAQEVDPGTPPVGWPAETRAILLAIKSSSAAA